MSQPTLTIPTNTASAETKQGIGHADFPATQNQDRLSPLRSLSIETDILTQLPKRNIVPKRIELCYRKFVVMRVF